MTFLCVVLLLSSLYADWDSRLATQLLSSLDHQVGFSLGDYSHPSGKRAVHQDVCRCVLKPALQQPLF